MKRKIIFSDTYMESIQGLRSASKSQILATLKKISITPHLSGLNRKRFDSGFWTYRVNDDIRIVGIEKDDCVILVYIGRHDDANTWASKRNLSKHTLPDDELYDMSGHLSINIDDGHSKITSNNDLPSESSDTHYNISIDSIIESIVVKNTLILDRSGFYAWKTKATQRR